MKVFYHIVKVNYSQKKIVILIDKEKSTKNVQNIRNNSPFLDYINESNKYDFILLSLIKFFSTIFEIDVMNSFKDLFMINICLNILILIRNKKDLY